MIRRLDVFWLTLSNHGCSTDLFIPYMWHILITHLLLHAPMNKKYWTQQTLNILYYPRLSVYLPHALTTGNCHRQYTRTVPNTQPHAASARLTRLLLATEARNTWIRIVGYVQKNAQLMQYESGGPQNNLNHFYGWENMYEWFVIRFQVNPKIWTKTLNKGS